MTWQHKRIALDEVQSEAKLGRHKGPDAGQPGGLDQVELPAVGALAGHRAHDRVNACSSVATARRLGVERDLVGWRNGCALHFTACRECRAHSSEQWVLSCRRHH